MEFPNNWFNIHPTLYQRCDEILLKKKIGEFVDTVPDVVTFDDGLHWYCGYADVRVILFRGKRMNLNIPYISNVKAFNLLTGEQLLEQDFITQDSPVSITFEETGNYFIEVTSPGFSVCGRKEVMS